MVGVGGAGGESGFRDWGLGVRVRGLGVRVQVIGFRVQDSGVRVQGIGCYRGGGRLTRRGRSARPAQAAPPLYGSN